MKFRDLFFLFCLGMANLWTMVGFITKQDTAIYFLIWLIGCVAIMILMSAHIKRGEKKNA